MSNSASCGLLSGVFVVLGAICMVAFNTGRTEGVHVANYCLLAALVFAVWELSAKGKS